MGKIEFRTDVDTKTDMILARPGDLVLSGINAAKGAIALHD
jgi:type I restriction enzyme S subunit